MNSEKRRGEVSTSLKKNPTIRIGSVIQNNELANYVHIVKQTHVWTYREDRHTLHPDAPWISCQKHDKVPRWCIVEPEIQASVADKAYICQNENHEEEGKYLTPASTAIGLPRWSSSASSSSILLLIKEVILGILALITDSKCWKWSIEQWKDPSSFQIAASIYIYMAGKKQRIP